MKLINLLLLIFLLASCTKGNESAIENQELKKYTGFYEIVSFKSDIAVDLNNDGVSSEELLGEIDYFNFQDLEISPRNDTERPTKLASFFLPKTVLTLDCPGNAEGHATFIKYGFVTSYTLEEGRIKLTENTYLEETYLDNVKQERVVTIGNDITLVDAQHLKATVAKEYYDFKDKRWKLLHIDVLYEKREIK